MGNAPPDTPQEKQADRPRKWNLGILGDPLTDVSFSEEALEQQHVLTENRKSPAQSFCCQASTSATSLSASSTRMPARQRPPFLLRMAHPSTEVSPAGRVSRPHAGYQRRNEQRMASSYSSRSPMTRRTTL
jgi:hypothetical protein